MKAVFADSSFYVALLNPRNVSHAKAVEVSERLKQPALLTDFIILELGSAAFRRRLAEAFYELSRQPALRPGRADRSGISRVTGSRVCSVLASAGQGVVVDGLHFVRDHAGGANDGARSRQTIILRQAGFVALLRDP